MREPNFEDRADAGRQLAVALAGLAWDDVVVLALPRGGVPVARPVAEELGAPLDVVVIRKIGAPANPEFALGAIGEGRVEMLDQRSMRRMGVDRDALEPIIARERAELSRRLQRYRQDRPGVDVAGRTALVVDDGVATGSTAMAAADVLRTRGARRVVLAVPVAPPDAVARLRQSFDEVIALAAPPGFVAVGQYYRDFGQTSDAEVVAILDAHARGGSG